MLPFCRSFQDFRPAALPLAKAGPFQVKHWPEIKNELKKRHRPEYKERKSNASHYYVLPLFLFILRARLPSLANKQFTHSHLPNF